MQLPAVGDKVQLVLHPQWMEVKPELLPVITVTVAAVHEGINKLSLHTPFGLMPLIPYNENGDPCTWHFLRNTPSTVQNALNMF